MKLNIVAAYRQKWKVNGDVSKCSGHQTWLKVKVACWLCLGLMYKLGYISTFIQRNIWQGSALCQRRYTDLWKMACSRGIKCAGKGIWGFVDSSVLSFLFILVDTSAEGKQSSVLYRAVACYVLTMPDLSRAHERKLMCYTMAQAFPLPSPLILEFGLKFSWQFRGTISMGASIGLGVG